MARHHGGSTITRTGKYTPTPYYTKPKTEASRHPSMHRVRLHGGKSAKVVKSPPRGC